MGMKPYLATVILLMGTTARVCLAQGASLEVPLPQLTRLELAVRVDYDAERLGGTATLTLRNASAVPLVQVPLLLNRLLRIEAARAAGRSLRFQQRLTSFEDVPTFQVNAVEVALAEPVPPGASVSLVVEYAGYLVGYTEVGMRYVQDHVARDFTILREDALAFPTVGVPSLRANRAAPRIPFDFEVAVTTPRGLVVATGGEELGQDNQNGLVTWRSRSRSPAPFLLIAIAPYHVAEWEGIRVFHFAGDSAGGQRVLAGARHATRRLEEIFGPLTGPLALNVMEIPDGWGSQASLTGGIIQEAGTFRDAASMRPLYHELSHLWNAPDQESPSPRWNEGLAMFLQDRLARELDDWDGGPALLEQQANRLLEQCGAGQRCGDIPLRQYGSNRMTDWSYSVGRLMFAALFLTLGQDPFDRALHRHYQERKTAGTTTDHLVAAFVETGGEPARRIFADWLESTRWIQQLRDAGSLAALVARYRP